MTKRWYPVIDYVKCTECGTCISKCRHGVYDTAKAPSPVVKNPEACIDRCHGCGNRCPAGAITYVGDNTGWTPTNGMKEFESSCCSSGSDSNVTNKKAVVEYLYLDLQTCDRCIGTDKVLDEVMTILSPSLKLAGYGVVYNKIEMETLELAERYRFISSPTIRVNGRDICTSVKENSCGCCSEISETDVDCRVFEYNGEAYEVPPKEMLANTILHAVFGQSVSECSYGSYVMPNNLKDFFEGKKSKSGCSCGSKCC